MPITFDFNPFAEESAMFIPQGKTLKELHDEQFGRVFGEVFGGMPPAPGSNTQDFRNYPYLLPERCAPIPALQDAQARVDSLAPGRRVPTPLSPQDQLESLRLANEAFVDRVARGRCAQPWLITPEDFGAIGDGIHDDTAAIQAFINAGGGEMGAGKVYRTQAWLTTGPIMDSDKPGILAHKVVTEPVPVPVDTRKPALAGLGCIADIDHRPGAWK